MQASSSSSHVPPELELDIIEYLHDDEGALHNCSLVSKIWAEYSRGYLWEKTALIRKDEAGVVSERHTARVEGIEVQYFFRATSMEGATAFFTAKPALAKLVKKLRIDGFIGVTVDALSSLLTALPQLCYLEILYTDFPPLAEAISDLDRGKLVIKPVYAHRFDFVYFHRCNIVERDIDMLLRVLGLFSSIDVLDFEGPVGAIEKMEVEGWSFNPTTHLRHDVPHPPLSEVRKLIPDVIHASVLDYLFSNTTLTRNLEHLVIGPSTIRTFTDLDYMARKLLPAVSNTMKHFLFIPGPDMGMASPQGPEEHQAIDRTFTCLAQSCASVEDMSLQLTHNSTPGWQPFDFSYVVDGFVKALERLPPSAALKTVTLTVFVPVEDATDVIPPRTVSTAEVVRGYNWPGLERALLKGPRSDVRTVIFLRFVTRVARDDGEGMFPSTEAKELEFAKAVRARMPKLWKTGRLAIFYGEYRTSTWGPVNESGGVSPS